MDCYEKINLHCKGKVDTMENEKAGEEENE